MARLSRFLQGLTLPIAALGFLRCNGLLLTPLSTSRTPGDASVISFFNHKQCLMRLEDPMTAFQMSDNNGDSDENVDPNGSSTKETNITTIEEGPMNLYDILGASPDDSKAELKRKYVFLAKQTHPDASRDGSELRTDLDFSEISAAYKVLSDPKEKRRYDRRIQAEAFSKEIQEFAGDVADKAAPQVRDILDTVAMPFLRR